MNMIKNFLEKQHKEGVLAQIRIIMFVNFRRGNNILEMEIKKNLF